MSNTVFEFREFTISQENCAMKVGTDGVLLGAWCCGPDSMAGPRILDIGTGTGIIALMCAQRWAEAQIDAVEIDTEAAAQASFNFLHSPWSERLTVHPVSLSLFHHTHEPVTYDLIVSNPPFYNATLLPDDERRATARHTNALPWGELMKIAGERLSAQGNLCIIFPSSEWDKVVTAAMIHGLSPVRITDVVTRQGKESKRMLAAFSLQPQIPARTVLYIRDGAGEYTPTYLKLVGPFYKSLK